MAQLATFTISLCLSFVFSLVLSARGRFIAHPEFIPESPAQYPVAKGTYSGAAALEEVSPGGQAQPFLDQNNGDVATLQPLLIKLATAINELDSQVSELSSSTTVDLASLSVSPSVASLGCSIYSVYQSICSVDTAPSAVSAASSLACAFEDGGGPIPCGAPSSEELFASCACYSSTLWVPDLYDNAVWACNQLPTSSGSSIPGFTPSIYTFDGTPTGFCNFNNPRLASFAYGLSTTATTTATLTAATSPAVTSKPTTTAATTSPTSDKGNSASTVLRLCGMERWRWVLIWVIALVASV